MQPHSENENAFLEMHLHFQILHFKLNFGMYLLGYILKNKSQLSFSFSFKLSARMSNVKDENENANSIIA